MFHSRLYYYFDTTIYPAFFTTKNTLSIKENNVDVTKARNNSPLPSACAHRTPDGALDFLFVFVILTKDNEVVPNLPVCPIVNHLWPNFWNGFRFVASGPRETISGARRRMN